MGINYSVEADPETTAKGMLRDRPISLKHSKAISRAIKGKTVTEAEAYLEDVRANYERLIGAEPDRFHRIDATRSREAVVAEARAIVSELLG